MPEENAEIDFGEEPETVRVNVTERVRKENHPVIYTNWAEVGATPWDMRIIFGQLSDATSGKAVVNDLVTVVMAPPLAKALLSVLNANIKGWESDNGEIEMPLSIKREAEKRAAAKAEAEAVVFKQKRNRKRRGRFLTITGRVTGGSPFFSFSYMHIKTPLPRDAIGNVAQKLLLAISVQGVDAGPLDLLNGGFECEPFFLGILELLPIWRQVGLASLDLFASAVARPNQMFPLKRRRYQIPPHQVSFAGH